MSTRYGDVFRWAARGLYFAAGNAALIGAIAAGLLSPALVFSDEILTREEMRPEIYEYPKPLYCQFIETKEDGTQVLSGGFILTWAELEAIDKQAMIFKKDGKEYRVPAESGYICTRLLG